jgi:hypothetical protein
MMGSGGYGGGMSARPVRPDDPEMQELLKQDMELDHRAHELASSTRSARGEERTRLKGELATLVNKHFDVRQKRRELQLKRMEEELQRLREAIAKRDESREAIVAQHLAELIGEAPDLEF